MTRPQAMDMLSLHERPEELRQALELLGVSPDASPSEAAERYRAAIRAVHPDLHQDSALRRAMATEDTMRINRAWELVRPAARALASYRPGATPSAVRTPTGRRVVPFPQTRSVSTARVLSAEQVHLAPPRLVS